MRFVAFGELMLDVEIRTGADAHGATIAVRAGGTAANAAAWAAAEGAEDVCVGRVGDDAAAAAIEAALRRANVEPRLEVDATLPTGVFAVVDGVRSVDRGANAGLAATVPACDALLVSGYALLPDTRTAALEALRRSAAPVRALTGGSAAVARAHRDAFREAFTATTVLVLDEAEAEVLGPVEGPDVCVTRGGRGAVLRAGGDRVEAPGSGVSGDVAGAGDALAATLAVELALASSPADALERACAAGARAAASPTRWP